MPPTPAYKKTAAHTSTALARGGIRAGEVRRAAGASPGVPRPGSCLQRLRERGGQRRGDSSRGAPGAARPALPSGGWGEHRSSEGIFFLV